MTTSRVPDLADVLAARQRIAPHLQPTPLYRYPALDAVTGTHLWVKHENHQPVGAFKVRGGVNLVSQVSADERRRGVIAASPRASSDRAESSGKEASSSAVVGRLDDNRHLDRLPLNRPAQVRATMTGRHIWHGTMITAIGGRPAACHPPRCRGVEDAWNRRARVAG